MRTITQEQVEAIKTLFTEAEHQGILLWLESGWAIDARLGKITRAHEDIDVAFPDDHRTTYLELIKLLRYNRYQEMDYGFLTFKDGILLDSEPCFQLNGKYNLKGFPSGTCPFAKEGTIDVFKVRCLNWKGMYFEFLNYMVETPQDRWRPQDFDSLKVIKNQIGIEDRKLLQEQYKRSTT